MKLRNRRYIPGWTVPVWPWYIGYDGALPVWPRADYDRVHSDKAVSRLGLFMTFPRTCWRAPEDLTQECWLIRNMPYIYVRIQ
jgi:hypothetical protein